MQETAVLAFWALSNQHMLASVLQPQLHSLLDQLCTALQPSPCPPFGESPRIHYYAIVALTRLYEQCPKQSMLSDPRWVARTWFHILDGPISGSEVRYIAGIDHMAWHSEAGWLKECSLLRIEVHNLLVAPIYLPFCPQCASYGCHAHW